jgi:hypothetical protein
VVVRDAKGELYPRCTAFNADVLGTILHSSRTRLVILHARWDVGLRNRIRDYANPVGAFEGALAHLLDTLNARHVAVLVIGNTPQFHGIPAHCYGRAYLLGWDPSPCMSEPRSAGVDPLVVTDRLLSQAVLPRTAFARYHPAFADLCDGKGCHAFSAGRVLYADEHHLSPAGAALIGQRLDAALRNWPR